MLEFFDVLSTIKLVILFKYEPTRLFFVAAQIRFYVSKLDSSHSFLSEQINMSHENHKKGFQNLYQ